MKLTFSHVANVKESATVKVNGLALQKKAKGERVYNLSAGEPILPTPKPIVEAAQNALKEGKTLYTPAAGIPELRDAATSWMNRTYGANYERKNIIATCGGKWGVSAVMQALLNPGDEVLVIAPFWVSYPSIVSIFNGVPKIITTDSAKNWRIDPADIQKTCASKTKILILNNGGNPTGTIYSKEELREILTVAKKNNLIVLSDEVYSGLTYEGGYTSAASFPEFDNVVVIQSCSKHFAMTGWRVGFVFGPEDLIKILTMLQSQSTTGTSSISQWAAVAAFTNAENIIPAINSELKKRRDFLAKALNSAFNAKVSVPQAGLYFFLPIKMFGEKFAEMTSEEFCVKVLDEGSIAMVPGSAFGAEGYVRMSFGAEEKELKEAVAKLAEYLSL